MPRVDVRARRRPRCPPSARRISCKDASPRGPEKSPSSAASRRTSGFRSATRSRSRPARVVTTSPSSATSWTSRIVSIRSATPESHGSTRVASTASTRDVGTRRSCGYVIPERRPRSPPTRFTATAVDSRTPRTGSTPVTTRSASTCSSASFLSGFGLFVLIAAGIVVAGSVTNRVVARPARHRAREGDRRHTPSSRRHDHGRAPAPRWGRPRRRLAARDLPHTEFAYRRDEGARTVESFSCRRFVRGRRRRALGHHLGGDDRSFRTYRPPHHHRRAAAAARSRQRLDARSARGRRGGGTRRRRRAQGRIRARPVRGSSRRRRSCSRLWRC